MVVVADETGVIWVLQFIVLQ